MTRRTSPAGWMVSAAVLPSCAERDDEPVSEIAAGVLAQAGGAVSTSLVTAPPPPAGPAPSTLPVATPRAACAPAPTGTDGDGVHDVFEDRNENGD